MLTRCRVDLFDGQSNLLGSRMMVDVAERAI
jgi:hypothetical protein